MVVPDLTEIDIWKHAPQDKGLLDPASASVARSLVGEGRPLEDAVLAADGLTEDAVLRYLAETFEVPYIDAARLETAPPAREFLAAFPVRLLLRHRLLPMEEKDGTTLVATSRITSAASWAGSSAIASPSRLLRKQGRGAPRPRPHPDRCRAGARRGAGARCTSCTTT